MPARERRPLTIAHRAGNGVERTLEAFAKARVDYVEADVWLHRGRLEVRHDKTAGPLPVLWERWRISPSFGRRLVLDEILDAAEGRGDVFIDCKGNDERLAAALADAVGRHDAAGWVACCGGWAHLDRLRTLAPQVRRFYTAGSLRRLAQMRPRLRHHEIDAVSIDSRFLTREIVAELKALGVATIATWAVADASDAERVLGWGVDAIIADDLGLLLAIRKGEVGR